MLTKRKTDNESKPFEASVMLKNQFHYAILNSEQKEKLLQFLLFNFALGKSFLIKLKELELELEPETEIQNEIGSEASHMCAWWLRFPDQS